MAFQLRTYREPDFTQEKFQNSPDAQLHLAPKDMTAPGSVPRYLDFPGIFQNRREMAVGGGIQNGLCRHL